ncbi:hypothetical protein M422DRAFT_36971 [Sphaerobolus stellatus SS14]|uniref:Uncharacterized protein n=1 Tax=Sphaerobolus stellatus (strain SS14) TaxID=990650 RepID=A0A0C9UK96_SPHS4|nr:hypothetical protein M422DRAFT_36971 [Sphaerobolus stellatus SS14]
MPLASQAAARAPQELPALREKPPHSLSPLGSPRHPSRSFNNIRWCYLMRPVSGFSSIQQLRSLLCTSPRRAAYHCRQVSKPTLWSFPSLPSKVEVAFRSGHVYVPYIALTHAARLMAYRGKEDFILNVSGGLTAKGLDRRNKRSISVTDWHAAAKIAEVHTASITTTSALTHIPPQQYNEPLTVVPVGHPHGLRYLPARAGSQ